LAAGLDVGNTGCDGPRAISARTQPRLNPPLILVNALMILLRPLPPWALLGTPGPFFQPSQYGDEFSTLGFLLGISGE
jgi:hypothetical protein